MKWLTLGIRDPNTRVIVWLAGSATMSLAILAIGLVGAVITAGAWAYTTTATVKGNL